jgi:hypothetical protein
MSAEGPRSALTGAGWTAILVHQGLARFAADLLPGDAALVQAVADEAPPPAEAPDHRDWEGLLDALADAWPDDRNEGPLGRLVDELGIGPPGLFLLGLAGACEESHLVGLLLDRLQSPETGARPRVHLVLAMARELFGVSALDVHWLLSLPTLASGLLTLEGEGPLPTRVLRVHPILWSVLNGRPVRWPGCRVVSEGDRERLLPAAITGDIPALADLLRRGHARSLVIRGPPGGGKGILAAEIGRAAGLLPLEVPVDLWKAEPALPLACRHGAWLPLLRPRLGPGDLYEPPTAGAVCPVAWLLGADGAVAGEGQIEIRLPLPGESERRVHWLRELGDADQPGLAETAANALLGGPMIATLAERVGLLAAREGVVPAPRHLAEARALLGSERLRLLAEPVTRRVSADALVMPPQLQRELDAVVGRCRRRESLWRGLGATLEATVNPGVRVLLVGESGTGKTLAASYLATVLGAPLYRVDLAAVMNKYIGESEKNLGALLDQAAANDVVLLFDEADSLFGRRSDRKETGERYANMLTNFLLTRIESHPGLVLLTTNSRERIDAAFTRRLDQILEVPLPGFEERLRLWHSHLGGRSPGEETCRTLAAYCELNGGQIRNVVLTAAALAREREGPLVLGVLIEALRGEYRKSGRALPSQIERLERGAETPGPRALP